MKIAFHSSYLGFRGTEIALMDYALGNREILGNRSFFLLPWVRGAENHPVSKIMQNIAPLRFYRTVTEREGILQEEGTDFFYCIKNGYHDGAVARTIPTGIHAIFRESEFHGDVYAYVSSWLSEVMAYGKAPWVPHMVRLAEENGDLRAELGIAKSARIFGRHGGEDSFDIAWVCETVVETARNNPEINFLFLNTRKFPGADGLSNIRFLPPTADPVRKRKFLNSCDAMLHGRMRGETFGLSCLEFAMLNKPVLTYAHSPEKAHLGILGDQAVRYENAKQLRGLLCRLASVIKPRANDKERRDEGERRSTQAVIPHPSSGPKKDIDSKFTAYQPKAVMKKFKEVFLR